VIHPRRTSSRPPPPTSTPRWTRWRLPDYQRHRIHAARLSISQTAAACEDLLGLSRDQRAALPYLHPGRVDVIGAGALIWWRVIERVAAVSGVSTWVTSEHDILDGIAASQVS
jgi:exopolyphosphatase/guanosine-5'-triphosphate,3'-diphosphate pyrophosphatase